MHQTTSISKYNPLIPKRSGPTEAQISAQSALQSHTAQAAIDCAHPRAQTASVAPPSQSSPSSPVAPRSPYYSAPPAHPATPETPAHSSPPQPAVQEP